MTKAQRLLVITENGRVVGTQFISPPVNGVPSVSVGLQCGPGQGLHEIEMEPPAALRSLEQFHQFHEDVAKKLGADKLYLSNRPLATK